MGDDFNILQDLRIASICGVFLIILIRYLHYNYCLCLSPDPCKIRILTVRYIFGQVESSLQLYSSLNSAMPLAAASSKSLNFKTNKGVKIVKRTFIRNLPAFIMTIVLMLTIVVQPSIASTQANYGESYHIQNQESSSENYLTSANSHPHGFNLTANSNQTALLFTDNISIGNLASTDIHLDDISVVESAIQPKKTLKYGQSYYSMNQMSGGHLNVGGKADYCAATTKFNITTDLDQTGATLWTFESPTGASDRTAVSIGDLVYLQKPEIESHLGMCGQSGCPKCSHCFHRCS